MRQQGVFLTTGIDSPTSGFSLSPNGTPLLNGFTATTKGQIFNALPSVSALGIGNNTLNTGDNIQDTVGDGTLNYTATGATLGIVAANPPFVTNLTMNGVSTLGVTNAAAVLGFPFVAGFQGAIKGLTVVNDTNSQGTVQLGGIAQGLQTLLTNVNVSGYGNNSAFLGAGTTIFAGIVATAAADATKTINVGITGPVGTTKAGGADSLIFSNDTTAGTGTAANPNLSYGTWAITTNATSDLQLQQDFNGFIAGSAFLAVPGGVGGATGLTLEQQGGTLAVGQDAIGNWRLVKDINASGSTSTVIVTGATAGNGTNAFGTKANPRLALWQRGWPARRYGGWALQPDVVRTRQWHQHSRCEQRDRRSNRCTEDHAGSDAEPDEHDHRAGLGRDDDVGRDLRQHQGLPDAGDWRTDQGTRCGRHHQHDQYARVHDHRVLHGGERLGQHCQSGRWPDSEGVR